MYYTKYLFLLLTVFLVLGGCASGPSKAPTTLPAIEKQNTDTQEPSIENIVTLYQDALDRKSVV